MRTAAALLILIAVIAAGIIYLRPGDRVPRGIPVLDDAAAPRESVPFAVEEVASGLEVPWSILFTGPDRMLVSERPGRIRVIEGGVLQDEPLHVFPEVSSTAEEGLMSLALHPDYAANKLVYAVYAYAADDALFDRVVRFRDEGDTISDLTTIIDRIPGARYHAGSRLAFGPDGKLYVTTGDATDRVLAQDLDSLAGKILRLDDDGTIPADNPFPDSPVWSYGHRNPQGLAWDSSGALYETEHGPSTFDGPPGGDEVNRIEKGANYGWPLVSHDETHEGTMPPLIQFTPAEAPGSALIYSGRLFPQFAGDLFFGALVGEGLMRISFNDGSIAGYEKLGAVDYGRIREVVEGPDGAIYFSTSNRDGRGSPAQADDRIFRIVPAQ